MKYSIFFLCFCFTSTLLYSQEELTEPTKVLDSLYKEDQFYFSVTYNIIDKKPRGLSQSGFSGGFHFGYTKDMPINKKRNKAIGIGLGLSFNSFNQNMKISENSNGDTFFGIIDEDNFSFSKNKFSTYMLELPIEYRWRTSTAETYKFWRIYTGFKLGYVFASQSKFEGDPDNVKIKNISAINKLQYGLTLSTGYNTWNFYLYYPLNTLFNDSSKINGETLEIHAIKVGLIFYIL